MIHPKFENTFWLKDNITLDDMFNSLKKGIHPIHYVKEDIIEQCYDSYALRKCVSNCGQYYKINYGNIGYDSFEKYQFLYFCRGDVLKVGTDEIVAKAPNKFWNINEISLTKSENFNWKNFLTIEKMDGMLIVPYKNAKGEWKITSRGSFEYEVIPVAESYFNENYKAFCEALLSRNLYPVFEIISKESFIKVEYSPSKYGLYFIGVSNVEGDSVEVLESIELAKQYNIITPTVYEFNSKSNVENFINSFERYYDFEGVVVHFAEGVIKLKAEKYCEANIQKLSNSEFLYDMWLEGKVDDMYGHLPSVVEEPMKEKIKKFEDIQNHLNSLYNEHYAKMSVECESIKDVALYIQKNIHTDYFNYFIMRYKKNEIGVKKSLRTITLNNVK